MPSGSYASNLGIKWQHLLIAAGGAAAAGGLVYYLLRGDKKSEQKHPEDYSKEDVLRVLNDITVSQEKLKVILKDFTQELAKKEELSLEETYYLIDKLQPEDPLERYNLSMQEFDVILDLHQNTPEVRNAIEAIMGAPGPVQPSIASRDISKEKLILIHQFMVDELTKLADEFEKLDQSKFNRKSITIAAQAQVGAKVEREFGYSSEEIESAVLINSKELQGEPAFGSLNVRMHTIMRKLNGDTYYGVP